MSTHKLTTLKIEWFDLIYTVFYEIILLLGEYIWLYRFRLGDEILDVFGVDVEFSEFRSNVYLIFYDRHEF